MRKKLSIYLEVSEKLFNFAHNIRKNVNTFIYLNITFLWQG